MGDGTHMDLIGNKQPEEATYARPDVGHINEMTAALEENSQRLNKAIDSLASRISPILMPTDPMDDSESVPKPIRCEVADQLARVNDRVFSLIGYVERLVNRVDI